MTTPYIEALKREAGMVGLSVDRAKAIAAEIRRAVGVDGGGEPETAEAPAPPETAAPKSRRK